MLQKHLHILRIKKKKKETLKFSFSSEKPLSQRPQQQIDFVIYACAFISLNCIFKKTKSTHKKRKQSSWNSLSDDATLRLCWGEAGDTLGKGYFKVCAQKYAMKFHLTASHTHTRTARTQCQKVDFTMERERQLLPVPLSLPLLLPLYFPLWIKRSWLSCQL